TTQAALFLHTHIFLRHGLFDKVFFLNPSMRRLWCTFLPNGLDKFLTLLAQDALHAANCVSLAVQKMAYAAQKVDVVGSIIAAAAAAFHRLDFVKAAFPKAQHVLRQIEFIRHFTDRTESVRRLVVQSGPLLRFDTRGYADGSAYAGCSPLP